MWGTNFRTIPRENSKTFCFKHLSVASAPEFSIHVCTWAREDQREGQSFFKEGKTSQVYIYRSVLGGEGRCPSWGTGVYLLLSYWPQDCTLASQAASCGPFLPWLSLNTNQPTETQGSLIKPHTLQTFQGSQMRGTYKNENGIFNHWSLTWQV